VTVRLAALCAGYVGIWAAFSVYATTLVLA
jgi:predicted metal-binding membrane protein